MKIQDIDIYNQKVGDRNGSYERQLTMAPTQDHKDVQAWLVGSGVALLAAAVHLICCSSEVLLCFFLLFRGKH